MGFLAADIMAELSPSIVGLIFFLGIACFCAAYYYGAEKHRLEFLSNRLSLKESDTIDKNSRAAKIAEKLRDIGSPMEASKLLQISYMVMIGSVVFGFALDVPLVGILFAVLGFKLPEIYLDRKKAQLDEEFDKQFPSCVDTLYAILEAGQTAVQGFELLSKDAPFPSNLEFGRIYNDIQTGATVKDALLKFYERHPSSDIKLFMTGTLVSIEAGPAVLVNTLKTINQTIRTRNSQKKSTKSAIMQGKVTIYIMSAAPVVALVILLTFMPDYSAPLLEDTIGNVMVVAALVLDAIGYFVASKITDTSSIVKY